MPRTHTAYPREFREQMVALVRAGRKPEDNRVSPLNPPGETRIRSCPSLQPAAVDAAVGALEEAHGFLIALEGSASGPHLGELLVGFGRPLEVPGLYARARQAEQ